MMSRMDGGSEVRRPPLRVLRRGAAVVGLCASGLFGFGFTTAGAQTVPCILVVCLPSPTPTLPLPTATLPLPLPTLSTPLPTVSNPFSLPTTTVSAPADLPTPTPSNPVSGTTGSDTSGCSVTVAGVCVLTSQPPGPTPPTCLTGSTDPTCILPGGTSPGGSPNGNGGGAHSSGGGPGSSSSGSGADHPLATGTFSAFGGGGLNGSDPPGGAAQAIPLGLRVANIPPLEQLGPGSGFQFGHALILWPLFGLLDVLGLAAVYLVVRRFRATRAD
jgi:hypothetical protein